MKRMLTIPVAATVIMLALGLTNCKKESTPGNFNESKTGVSGIKSLSELTAKDDDRIEAIVSDLSQSSYSLSFDKPIPTRGIHRDAYGAESYLAYADPQDLICGIPLTRYQKKIPMYKWPTFVEPTCPTMIIDPLIYKKLKEFLINADPLQFRGLQDIHLSNGGTFMAGQAFVKQFASMQPDKIDEITKDLDHERYLLLTNTDDRSNGLFTRGFYGYANLDEYVFGPHKLNWKDLIHPKMVGCFDPEILTTIDARFKELSPELFKNLGVTTVPDANDVGILTMGN